MERTARLGATGIVVSRLGVGAMPWSRKAAAGAKGAFEASLDAGVTLIDTAEIYGRGQSEQLVGRFARARPGAFVATKFAPLPHRLRTGSLAKALTGSLRRMRLDRVDLYQVHWPYSALRIESLMEALAGEVEAGRVGAVGVSNYSAAQMRRAHAALARRGVTLASNQVHYSLLHRAPERNGVLAACRELDVALIAYTPLASGALTGKYVPGGPRPGGYRRFAKPFRRLAEVQPLIGELERIGREHGHSVGQVALNWLARQDLVIPIPGAKDAPQAASNAGALAFDLDAEETERLDRLSSGW